MKIKQKWQWKSWLDNSFIYLIIKKIFFIIIIGVGGGGVNFLDGQGTHPHHLFFALKLPLKSYVFKRFPTKVFAFEPAWHQETLQN